MKHLLHAISNFVLAINVITKVVNKIVGFIYVKTIVDIFNILDYEPTLTNQYI